MKSTLHVASCQFSVEPEIALNLKQILAQIQQAADDGARVVHFSETALSGYAGVDLPSSRELDWKALRAATADVCRAAAQHRVWVLLGSTHRLSDGHLPHNSVYIINDQGRIADRYDKRFCTGTQEPDCTLDHLQYTPGNHATVFEIDGFRCSALVCYDYRFPELYRELKRLGVEIVFQSFHNARRDYRTFHTRNIWKELVPATMMCHAATNHFWVSATNSTARYSLWGSFFVRPDGRITGRLPVQQPGVLFSNVDAGIELWDASAPWRERAMNGELHSGTLVDDPRSDDRTCC